MLYFRNKSEEIISYWIQGKIPVRQIEHREFDIWAFDQICEDVTFVHIHFKKDKCSSFMKMSDDLFCDLFQLLWFNLKADVLHGVDGLIIDNGFNVKGLHVFFIPFGDIQYYVIGFNIAIIMQEVDQVVAFLSSFWLEPFGIFDLQGSFGEILLYHPYFQIKYVKRKDVRPGLTITCNLQSYADAKISPH